MSDKLTIDSILKMMAATRPAPPIDVSRHLLRPQIGVEPGHLLRLDMTTIPIFWGVREDQGDVIVYVNHADREALGDMSDQQVLEAVEALTRAQEQQARAAFLPLPGGPVQSAAVFASEIAPGRTVRITVVANDGASISVTDSTGSTWTREPFWTREP